MTTRVTFSDGQVVEYDEEREAHPDTGNRSVSILNREYLGPTPPPARPGEDKQAQRDRLRAELAALGDDGDSEGEGT